MKSGNGVKKPRGVRGAAERLEILIGEFLGATSRDGFDSRYSSVARAARSSEEKEYALEGRCSGLLAGHLTLGALRACAMPSRAYSFSSYPVGWRNSNPRGR